MSKYTFNSELFKHIHHRINKTIHNMHLDILSCSYDTLKRNIRNGNPRIETFVEIVNTYRINFREYFVSEDTSMWNYTDGIWVPLEYHSEELKDYPLSVDKIKCDDLAKELSRRNYKASNVLSGGYYRETEKEYIETPTLVNNRVGEWKYNYELTRSLPDLLGILGRQVFEGTSHATRTYNYAIANKDIPVRALVSLCNSRRLNILCFFIHEGEIGMFHDIVISEEEFKPVEFHPERIRELASYRGMNLQSYDELLKKIGYTHNRLKRACDKVQSSLRANELARLCNVLNISIDYFFSSTKEEINDRVTRKLQTDINKLEAEKKEAQREARILQSRVKKLEEMLLKSKK